MQDVEDVDEEVDEDVELLCRVEEQKEDIDGLKDKVCGKVAEAGHAGLCKYVIINFMTLHCVLVNARYVTYLVCLSVCPLSTRRFKGLCYNLNVAASFTLILQGTTYRFQSNAFFQELQAFSLVYFFRILTNTKCMCILGCTCGAKLACLTYPYSGKFSWGANFRYFRG